MTEDEKRIQKWPDELVIVRHGQSERNVAKEKAKSEGEGKPVYVDSIRDQDTPLTQLGWLQARCVGVKLCDRERFDAIIISPYTRTRQTAESVVKGLGYMPHMVIEERLREIEFGILDGLTPEGVRAKYPEEVARRQKEGKYWYRPPGGESRPDVALRLQSFLDTLTRDYQGKRVILICHSVVVLMFRRLLERWDEADYLKVDKENDVKNCSITTYKFNRDRWKLLLDEYNAVEHMHEVTQEESGTQATLG